MYRKECDMNVVGLLVEAQGDLDACIGRGVRALKDREGYGLALVGVIAGDGVALPDAVARRYGLALVQGECRPEHICIIGTNNGAS